MFKKFIYVLAIVSALYSQKNHIKIENAYVRMMPPTAKMSASFMEIKNTSNKDTYLINAKSDIAEFTEIHRSRKLPNNMMEMKKVKKIKIPSRDSVVLKKGDYHIMFIKLKKPLIENNMVDLKLEFSNDITKNLKVPVK